MVRITPSPVSFALAQRKTALFKLDSAALNPGQTVTIASVTGSGELVDAVIHFSTPANASGLYYRVHVVVDGSDYWLPLSWINALTGGKGSACFALNIYDEANGRFSVTVKGIPFSRSLALRVEAAGTTGASVIAYAVIATTAGG